MIWVKVPSLILENYIFNDLKVHLKLLNIDFKFNIDYLWPNENVFQKTMKWKKMSILAPLRKKWGGKQLVYKQKHIADLVQKSNSTLTICKPHDTVSKNNEMEKCQFTPPPKKNDNNNEGRSKCANNQNTEPACFNGPSHKNYLPVSTTKISLKRTCWSCDTFKSGQGIGHSPIGGQGGSLWTLTQKMHFPRNFLTKISKKN